MSFYRKYAREPQSDVHSTATVQKPQKSAAELRADAARERAERMKRGKGAEVWGWGTAYGKPDTPQQQAPKGAKS